MRDSCNCHLGYRVSPPLSIIYLPHYHVTVDLSDFFIRYYIVLAILSVLRDLPSVVVFFLTLFYYEKL